MRKDSTRGVIAWLCVLLLALAMPVSAQTPVATPATEQPATSYWMDLTFDPVARTLAGSEEIAWINTTGAAQAEIYLRLYPEAHYYRGGGLTMDGLTVDGTPATATSGDDPTVAKIALPASVSPGQRATVALRFRTVIPVDSTASFGILRLDSRSGIWALADWYPIVAGYDAGQGWYLAPPSSLGDPTFSDASSYDVRLTLPADLTIAGTGVEQANPTPAGPGLVTRQFRTGVPAREFVLAVGSPGRIASRVVDGVTLRVMTLGQPFGTTPNGGLVDQLNAFTLDVAATAFRAYTRWFGPYDEPDLDVTFLSLEEAQGASVSGMAWISAPHVLDDGQLSDDERRALAFTVAHEIGHQWLGNIIGSNNNDYGFITESLDNALTPSALAGLPLPETPNDFWRNVIAGQYSPSPASGHDGIVDRPATASDQGMDSVALVYGKGPLGFEAICQRMGPDAYFAGLRAYGERSWLGISTPTGLLDALEWAARTHGEDPAVVADLWTHWFEQADTTASEVNAVLSHAGSCVPVS